MLSYLILPIWRGCIAVRKRTSLVQARIIPSESITRMAKQLLEGQSTMRLYLISTLALGKKPIASYDRMAFLLSNVKMKSVRIHSILRILKLLINMSLSVFIQKTSLLLSDLISLG